MNDIIKLTLTLEEGDQGDENFVLHFPNGDDIVLSTQMVHMHRMDFSNDEGHWSSYDDPTGDVDFQAEVSADVIRAIGWKEGIFIRLLGCPEWTDLFGSTSGIDFEVEIQRTKVYSHWHVAITPRGEEVEHTYVSTSPIHPTKVGKENRGSKKNPSIWTVTSVVTTEVKGFPKLDWE